MLAYEKTQKNISIIKGGKDLFIEDRDVYKNKRKNCIKLFKE